MKGKGLASYYDIYPTKRNRFLSFLVVFCFDFLFFFFLTSKKGNAVKSIDHNCILSDRENEAN